MIDIADVNAKILIAFSLTMITGLLTYIAFIKDTSPRKRSRKTEKK